MRRRTIFVIRTASHQLIRAAQFQRFAILTGIFFLRKAHRHRRTRPAHAFHAHQSAGLPFASTGDLRTWVYACASPAAIFIQLVTVLAVCGAFIQRTFVGLRRIYFASERVRGFGASFGYLETEYVYAPTFACTWITLFLVVRTVFFARRYVYFSSWDSRFVSLVLRKCFLMLTSYN